MKVEVWSDVVCPWCYVGKRHLEEALARFRHGDQVSVEWRSFELNPASPPRVGLSMSQILQRKYGMSEDQAEAANQRMTALAAAAISPRSQVNPHRISPMPSSAKAAPP